MTVWFQQVFRLRDFVVPTATVQLRISASELQGEAIIEAAFDDFEILDVD